MFGRGRHHSQANTPLTRGISRVLIAAAGSTGVALPLLGAGVAHAAGPAEAETKAAHGKANQQQSKPEAESGSYKVVKGDTLSRIARDKKVDGGWHKLYAANRHVIGGNPDLIHPGQTLSLDTQSAGTKPQGGRSGQAQDKPEAKDSGASGTSSENGSGNGSGNGSDASASNASVKQYPDNLDGWIREALDVMHQHNIPGSYEGIKRNIIRESGGNPNIVNNWDSNAAKGTPSKGLLQVIQPTFAQYHVAGTPNDMLDPVANIVAACNYAAATYGSIDNVNGPY